MIVLDASALLELLLGTARGKKVAAAIAAPDVLLAAPHLIDLEVAQVLRRLVARGEVSPRRAEQALDDLAALGLSRYGHEELLPRIWELRANLTAYDAAYVALAEATFATLVTSDAKLATAEHRATVRVVA